MRFQQTILLLGTICLLFPSAITCQNISTTDSLVEIYNSGKYEGDKHATFKANHR